MIAGSCHCGAVRIEVAHAPADLTDCNCSLCRRLGALWAYYPAADVTITHGADATEAYVQGYRKIAIHRCRGCGCVTHWDGRGPGPHLRVGVNARMLDPRDIAGLRIRKHDGADTWEYLDED